MTLYTLPPLLSLVCFMGLAILTLVRRPRTTVNLLFFVLCCLGVLLYGDIVILFQTDSASVALFVSRLDHVFVVYTMPVFIHFFHAYLKIDRRKWLVAGFYGYAFCLMWFAFTPYLIPSMNRHAFGYFGAGGPLYPLIAAGAAGAMAYGAGLLIRSVRHETRSIQKNKLKYMLAGFGLLGLLNGLNVLPLLNYPVYPPGAFSFIPLIVFTVGLFKYDLLDMGIILKKSLLYSMVTTVLTGVYASMVTVAEHAFQRAHFSESMFYPWVFFFFVAAVFGPAQFLVQKKIGRLFKKSPADFQGVVHHIGREITSCLTIEALAIRLTVDMGKKLRIEQVSLFLERTGHDHYEAIAGSRNGVLTEVSAHPGVDPFLGRQIRKTALPMMKKRLMERSHDPDMTQVLRGMERIGAEVVLPLRIESRCMGFISLGEKLSGSLYTREEIDLMATLSVQVALSIINARSYIHLGRLNRTLEQRVRQRTMALEQALLEKEASQAQLIRSESLAAIGQLVAGVAHEINNPLSAAISLLQSDQEDLNRLSGQNKSLCMACPLQEDTVFVEKELQRAKQIVASLLCLSRQTGTYTESVDINMVVRNALKVLQAFIKQHRIVVEKKLGRDIPSFSGNVANLGQAAINIIKNACQAMAPSSGVVKISTRYHRPAKQVVFSCRDHGTGINDAIRKDIFKPFFTTKPAGHGTGLGLYICHEIVRRHNGRMIQENCPDGGARFSLLLPVS